METINGYTVIAQREARPGERIILAVRTDEHSPSGFEYVTARCAPKGHPAATSWYWGHYTNDLAEAVSDLAERSAA